MSSVPRLNSTQIWQQSVTDEWNSPVDSSCVGVAECLETENLLHLATDLGFLHICQKQGHSFDQEVAAAEAMIVSPDAYFEFPVAAILSPGQMNSAAERALTAVDYRFTSSAQKHEVLSQINKAAVSKRLSQTATDDVLAVADEMFTNAVYNAPFVDINTQKNPGINRHTDEIKLDGGKFGRVFFASDAERLVIGCSDPFGSLDLKRYLNKIKATFVRGPAATMNFGPGGAGIGSYIIFNAGASLYFGVWPGKATTLCCVIPLGMSNRKRMQLPKHLHWIQR